MPCLAYRENRHYCLVLKVVYRADEGYMTIRIHRNREGYISIECVALGKDNADSPIDCDLWGNSKWMFSISKNITQEKTQDGKYFVTDSKGRREECYLIKSHTEEDHGYKGLHAYKISTLCPINREFRPSENMHFILPSDMEEWMCGECLPESRFPETAHILDLLDDEHRESKRQRVGVLVKTKVNEIDFLIDCEIDCETDNEIPIYLGMTDYCECLP